jgi:hypothetical protein
MRRVLVGLLAAVALVAGVVAPAGSATAPVSTAPPQIHGQALLGSTLQVEPGTWQPDTVTLTYQWTRDGAPIDGATGTTYALGEADLGTSIGVVETATDGTGATGTATADPVGPVRKPRLSLVDAPPSTG